MYYVANTRMPSERAHGIQIAKMCEAFIEAGEELELVVPARRDSAGSIREFYGLRVPVPARRLPVLDLYRLGSVGYRIASLSFSLSSLVFLLWRRFRGECFFVYVIDMDQFSFAPLRLVGVPYFFESHSAKRPSARMNFFAKRLRGTIVINRYIKKKFEEAFGIASRRIIVRPNGIDPAMLGDIPKKTDAGKRLGLPADAPILVYVGKFYPWKGLDILCDAALSLPEFRIFMVGGSADELRKTTARGDIPENLVCVGERPFREIPDWLGAADILIVLGTAANEYSYRQTSPMKLFEYLVAGKSIVAARTPAVEEIVSEKEAFFYEPDDAESLAVAVRAALAAGEDVREAMARSAREQGFRHTWAARAAAISLFIHEQIA